MLYFVEQLEHRNNILLLLLSEPVAYINRERKREKVQGDNITLI